MILWDVVIDYHGTPVSLCDEMYMRTDLEAFKFAQHVHTMLGIEDAVVELASREHSHEWVKTGPHRGAAILPFDWDEESW